MPRFVREMICSAIVVHILTTPQRSEVLRLIASYRDRTNQLTAVVSSRNFLSAGCTDAATEALIRSMLEEDMRQATKQRELEEKQSLELAARLAAEDAAANAPPSAALPGSPAGSALTPTRRAPPPPSQPPGPGKGPGKRTLESFCTTAPSNQEGGMMSSSTVTQMGGFSEAATDAELGCSRW